MDLNVNSVALYLHHNTLATTAINGWGKWGIRCHQLETSKHPSVPLTLWLPLPQHQAWGSNMTQLPLGLYAQAWCFHFYCHHHPYPQLPPPLWTSECCSCPFTAVGWDLTPPPCLVLISHCMHSSWCARSVVQPSEGTRCCLFNGWRIKAQVHGANWAPFSVWPHIFCLPAATMADMPSMSTRNQGTQGTTCHKQTLCYDVCNASVPLPSPLPLAQHTSTPSAMAVDLPPPALVL
jgi:hypothetical protein